MSTSEDFVQKLRAIPRTYQLYLDKSVSYVTGRWVGLGVLLLLFLLRIFTAQGWYIVCYALGIYLLNLFLLFLQPKFDPVLEQALRDEQIEEGTSGEGVGSSSREEQSDEFRPFIRRLPEFKFWYNASRASLGAFITTWFSIFDVPVFWPILLIYFILLFALTMRRQIQHMIKYKYLPFDLGKTKYGRS